MKNGNWIGLDKNIVKLLPHGRAYTIIEALISFTIDIDNRSEWTINGYSKQWGWSRNKVRKFANELRTGKGHLADRKGTGSGHLITLKLNNLHEERDRKRTGKGQEEDRKRDTTINPNPNPNPKKDIYGEFKNIFLKKEEYQKLLVKYSGSCDGMIERMSQHIETKSKDPYKSHYAAILKNEDWLKKKSQGGNNSGKHNGLNEKDYSEGIGKDGSF